MTDSSNYYQVRQNVGYRQLEDRCLIVVSGHDAGTYLQSQTTNDVLSLTIGEGQANALLDRKAHLKAFFILLRLAENVYGLIVEKNQAEALYTHLENFHFVEEVEVIQKNTDSFLLLLGPLS